MKNYWNMSLFLSFLIHTFVLLGLNNLDFFKKERKVNKVYQLNNIKIVKKEINQYKNGIKHQISPPPPYLNNFLEKITFDGARSLQKIDTIELTDKEIIFKEFLNTELKKNPEYMEYYQKIRAKISNILHKNYNGKVLGEVGLSFTLLKDGRVKDIYFKDNFDGKKVLEEIVLKSIYDAQPFPPFPEEFKDRRSLPFSVNIEFRNR